MDNIQSGDIETLFKVKPPFTEVDGGHGFVGVVMYSKKTDKLQCHICGRWVSHLPAHAWNSHKIKSLEYRKRFFLPLSFPLVSHGISLKIHDVNEKKELWRNFKGGKNRGKGGKRNNNAAYARNNASFHNKHGLCDKQIMERYILVAETVGHDPSEKEIILVDSPLAWAIRERFKSINRFKSQNGFEMYQFRKTAIGKIMERKESLGKTPDLSFLSKEDKSGIIKRFGSFRRALSYIGKEF